MQEPKRLAKQENTEEDIKFANESGEPLSEDDEEVLKQIAEASGVKEDNNKYYRILKQKQEENLSCIESEGAKDRRGKPCGFRRV